MALERKSIVLFILGHVAAAVYGGSLECTNDFDRIMICNFEAKNCDELNMTLLRNDGDGVEEKHCVLSRCDAGLCCCSVEMLAVVGLTYSATVWRGRESLENKTIDIDKTIKPKTPTIVKVKESDGNFQITWDTHMEGFLNQELTANVSYYKKGSADKVTTVSVNNLSEVNGLKYYEILGRDLEPGVTYAVSVKSYTDWSDRFSDSSEEREFTTPASPTVLVLSVIISLSLAAVIATAAVFACCVKFKSKLWDTVAKCSSPKFLLLKPSEEKFLKPDPLIISPVSVEPLVLKDSDTWSKVSMKDSSGNSTGSSCLSYANTEPANVIDGVQDALGKVFANIIPISAFTLTHNHNTHTQSVPQPQPNNNSALLISSSYNPCGSSVDRMNSGSFDFDNNSYSIHMPCSPVEILTGGLTQTEMSCDSAYRPNESVAQQQQQRAVNPPVVVPCLVPLEMSYQPCSDSGRYSNAEDSSLSSISSGTNTAISCCENSAAVSRIESYDDDLTKLNGFTEELITSELNPIYSRGLPAMVDDYQAFQSLIADKHDILFSGQKVIEKEENFSKYPDESFSKMPQSSFSLTKDVPDFMNNVADRQMSFLCPTGAAQSVPIITDSGYQSV